VIIWSPLVGGLSKGSPASRRTHCRPTGVLFGPELAATASIIPTGRHDAHARYCGCGAASSRYCGRCTDGVVIPALPGLFRRLSRAARSLHRGSPGVANDQTRESAAGQFASPPPFGGPTRRQTGVVCLAGQAVDGWGMVRWCASVRARTLEPGARRHRQTEYRAPHPILQVELTKCLDAVPRSRHPPGARFRRSAASVTLSLRPRWPM
jgi:hypothetical protein